MGKKAKQHFDHLARMQRRHQSVQLQKRVERAKGTPTSSKLA